VTQNRDKGQAPPSTGFQDITAEIGDVTIPLEGDMPQGERVDKDFFQDFAGGTVIVDENAPSQTPEIPSELRVLTGSSPKARPMWLEGLFSSGLGALVLVPIVLNIGLRGYQPWISLVVMVLALGAAAWSLFGLQAEKEDAGRRLCWIGAAVGLLVAVVAFLVRAPAM